MDNIFFDIDGTLHKEDVFFEFIKYSFLKKKLRFFLLSPVFFIAIIIYFLNKNGKIGINIMLYSLFFNDKNRENFLIQFCKKIEINKNKKVLDILNFHINKKNKIFLISGTPEFLIKNIYKDILKYENVFLIGSEISFGLNSIYLTSRCLSEKKLEALDKRQKEIIYFLEGYTDSILDTPVLNRCSHKFFVLKNGDLVELK